MKARLTTLLLALVMGGLVAAGCGGDETEDAGDPGPAENPPAQTETQTDAQDSASGGGAAQTIRNDAVPSGELAFEKDTLKAKPGQVKLVMDNPASIPHAIAIRGNNADASGDTVDKGGTSQVDVDLNAGEYEFYCPVPGHEQGGMKGTLTVE